MEATRELLDTAVSLTRRAGELTLRWFEGDDLVVDTKADNTPVTEADRQAERFLRRELTSRFPGDGILGEEDGEQPGSSGRRWIIDPIDGTKAFTHGVPLFANLLALLDGERPIIGVVNLPALGWTIAAGRGLGCWSNERPARVRERTDLSGAMVMTSGLETWSAEMLGRVQGAGARVRTWGDAYGYALVAAGRVDAMVDPIAALWDLAPMPVIMAEAGGRFSAVTGEDDPAAGSGLATNGVIHDRLRELLAG